MGEWRGEIVRIHVKSRKITIKGGLFIIDAVWSEHEYKVVIFHTQIFPRKTELDRTDHELRRNCGLSLNKFPLEFLAEDCLKNRNSLLRKNTLRDAVLCTETNNICGNNLRKRLFWKTQNSLRNSGFFFFFWTPRFGSSAANFQLVGMSSSCVVLIPRGKKFISKHQDTH